MALVNHKQQLADDNWTVVDTTNQPFAELIPAVTLSQLLDANASIEKVLLPLDAVLSPISLMDETLKLIQQNCKTVGIWFHAGHEVAVTTKDIDALLKLVKQDNTLVANLPLVVIHISAFADGRGFSLAEHLRLEGYTGEIRLSGEFGVDQFAYYQRSGVDSYLIADDKASDNMFATFNHLASAPAGKSVSSLPMFITQDVLTDTDDKATDTLA